MVYTAYEKNVFIDQYCGGEIELQEVKDRDTQGSVTYSDPEPNTLSLKIGS